MVNFLYHLLMRLFCPPTPPLLPGCQALKSAQEELGGDSCTMQICLAYHSAHQVRSQSSQSNVYKLVLVHAHIYRYSNIGTLN